MTGRKSMEEIHFPRSEPPAPPPHNLSAEAAVLGAILFDNNAYERASAFVRATDFYAPAHEKLYHRMATLIESGQVADGVTISEWVRAEPLLNELGGLRYLEQLLDSAAFGPEVSDYSKVIVNLSARRGLLDVGETLVADSHSPDPDERIGDVIDRARNGLQDVEDFRLRASVATVTADVADETFDEDPAKALQPTGMTELDQELGGLEPGAISFVGGRPGIGKTAFAICHMANEAAAGSSVGMFAADTGATVCRQRLAFYLAWMAGEETPFFSEMRKRGSPWITPEFRERMKGHLKSEVGQRIFIDGRGGLTTRAVSAQIRAWKMMCARRGLPPLRLVYLDHIAKFMPSQKFGSLYEKTSYASNELLDVAKDHPEIVFVPLVQLKRIDEGHARRPNMQDMRDSGKLEEDASAVLLLHRQDHYLSLLSKNQDLPESERTAAEEKLADVRGRMEVILPKNRNGEPSVVSLRHVIGKNIIRGGSDRPRGYIKQESML